MDTNSLNIARIRRNISNTIFETAYNKLISNQIEQLINNEKKLLLKSAIIFLNTLDESLEKLGYRIILSYCNQSNDYKPLYDVALNKGYIPVAKYIELNFLKTDRSDNSFFNTLLSSYKENYSRNGVYLSEGQQELVDFVDSTEGDFVLVAPTSYGKSEIIIDKVKKNKSKKVCVIVPTKSLLAQTKRRIINNNLHNEINKIITHPDMYLDNQESFIAILTQERLLRLTQKFPDFTLDLLLVDEAHNLLKGDDRAILLAQVLLITRKRNPNSIINFFSPFIANNHSLESPYSSKQLSYKKTEEFIKIEKYFSIDVQNNGHLELYDQFTNKFISITKFNKTSDLEFVNTYKATKNIVYINKPRDIENFSIKASQIEPYNVLNKFINELIASITEYVHPEYYLIDCIKNGVVYHHGSVPDIIRLYIESAFSQQQHFDFIVTNSTLLEGVNIPADKLFILSPKIGNRYFTKSELKNLAGRICRFSEIFNTSTGSLQRLEPSIYFIKGQYVSSKANINGFIERSLRSDLIISDKIDNVLLKELDDIEDYDEKSKAAESLEYLENIEPNTVKSDSIFYAQSTIAQLCYKNNVHDFDIKKNEESLKKNLAENLLFDINTSSYLVRAITLLFTKDIDLLDDNFKRMTSPSVQRYYTILLQWKADALSFSQMVVYLANYWILSDNALIYVGNKWGDINHEQKQGSRGYINLTQKTYKQIINLAIVRVKEEFDYIDNTLVKYIEIIKELGLVENNFYNQIKYGTDNQTIICFIRNGFTMELAQTLIKEVYQDYLTIDLSNDTVIINSDITQAMIENGENRILIFEVRYHIK
ncbi:DEAD/DEAH box helicase [Hymenobacter perfusus]|uniref:DEAD/DEAH box helicase n=1 Tax=Hymenobacter perfusus TaxID=1236770 RepID=A0A428K3U9_9BACT|nr:DEAD/DEAH box helicase [Hymenobacter perfusus]RSK41105.1 DEAD/DEAH box helicase [Hymenobacter perfusus]